jgi:hypothetical protein
MAASIVQLAGLASAVVGAVLEFGLSGGLVAGGVSAVFVGVAMEQR